jgi:predicted RNA-binding Zn-ribbon protein involved in translation (DUF1610 family)
MARQVIVKTWCDPCLEQSVDTEGEELPPLKLPELPGRARVLALCEVHRKELYDPLVEALRELGQTVDAEGNPAGARGPLKKTPMEPAITGPSSTPSSAELGPTTCPDCFKELKSLGSLQAHVRHVHNTTLRELQGHPKGEGFACPECGQVCLNAQGLGAHRSRKHGVAGKKATA